MLVFIFLMGQMLPESQKIELPEIRFSLTFPTTWTVKPGPFQAPLVGVAELAPRRGLAVMTRRDTGIATEDAMMRDFLGALNAQFESHEVVEKSRVNLTKEVRAWRFDIKGTARGNSLRNLTYMYAAFEQTFMITFSCKDDQYAELQPKFNAIMKTITFDGPAGYEKTQQFLKSLSADTIDYADLEAQLKAGANIDGKDMNRLTAMHLAVFDRNGKLVQWLLAHGAEPEADAASLFRMAGTPAIRRVLKLHKEKTTGVKEPEKTGKAKGLTLEWTNPEAQLHTGIKQPLPEFVKEALAKGADLTKLDASFQMAALPLVRWIIKDFEDLGLDATDYKAVEAILLEASAKK